MAVNLFAVTLDCPAPAKLARFYQGFLGGRVSVAPEEDFAVLVLDDDFPVRIDFQLAANPAPPAWPDPRSPRRHHLEFAVDDGLDDMERRLRELGATVPAHQPGGAEFRVFADPSGHLFCIAPRAATYVRDEPHE
ncbi:MAG TPA: VOC family protein [Streptosporangiaceae bacterium]|jgi:catechol 2,3-dioxygenase-like lactoylglutathione lyase family enzyme